MIRKIISLITFPGVITHELAHKTACDSMGVKVHKVVYFRFGNPSGLVEYADTATCRQTFWISISPFLLNTFLALVFSFFVLKTGGDYLLSIVLLWLAFSMGLHAFPSNKDMENVYKSNKQAIKQSSIITSIFYILFFPFVWLLWTLNKLRFFLFDIIYSVLLILIGLGILQKIFH